MSTATTAPEVLYPESDGKPVGETDWHIRALFSLYEGLGDHFAKRPEVYVDANMFLDYQERNSAANRCPDWMVILGVEKRQRGVFESWAEGAVPAVIFELASTQTFKNEPVENREIHASLGVREYYLIDPAGECLDVPLIGDRLGDGEHELVPLDSVGGLTSPILGLRLVPDGMLVRLVDPVTAQPIPTGLEKRVARETSMRETRQANFLAERERAEQRERELERVRAMHEGWTDSGSKSVDQGA